MSRLLLAFFLVVLPWASASAAEISAITEFTVRRHLSGFPTELDSDPFGFFGFVQEGDTLEDETFLEFDLSGFTQVSHALLRFEIRSSASNVPVARTFEVSTYQGTGIPSIDRLGTGQRLTSLSVEAQGGSNLAVLKQFEIDVSSLAQAALSAGASLGFRLHDPADVTPGSDHVPWVWYWRDAPARLDVQAPEPMTDVALGLALLGIAPFARHRWQRRQT